MTKKIIGIVVNVFKENGGK